MFPALKTKAPGGALHSLVWEGFRVTSRLYWCSEGPDGSPGHSLEPDWGRLKLCFPAASGPVT